MSEYFQIKHATFFANKDKKIENVNFSISSKGDIICLLGPSGVGKTTILRTIAGLKELEQGEIFLNNKLISSKNFTLSPEKRCIALSFQENCLFPHKSVIENISLGLERRNLKKFIHSSNDLINIFHLKGLGNKYPHEISSGEAQRVSLARSLLSNPDLLVIYVNLFIIFFRLNLDR